MEEKLMLIDTHVHTSEISSCGKVSAVEMVRLCKEIGYEAIIITDHYYEGYFENLRSLSWEQKIESFLSGYKLALMKGKSIGLKVFLGMEIRFSNSQEDYLVYGLNEEFLIENPRLYKFTLGSFRSYIKGTGAMIFQAHPFRKGLTPAPPSLLDGLEVYNGNPRHDSRNDCAFDYAMVNKLRMIGGSDAHQIEDIGRAGINIPRKIDSMHKFIEWYADKTKGEEHIYINDQIILP